MKIAYSIFIYTIFVVILGLSACQTTIENETVTISGPTTTVTTTTGISWPDLPTYNQFWGTIKANVGEEFAITLYRQPRLGVDWFASYDDNSLILIASDFKEYSTSFGNVNGDQYFIFKALNPGSTEITFVYKHVTPEADILDQKTFQVEIQ